MAQTEGSLFDFFHKYRTVLERCDSDELVVLNPSVVTCGDGEDLVFYFNETAFIIAADVPGFAGEGFAEVILRCNSFDGAVDGAADEEFPENVVENGPQEQEDDEGEYGPLRRRIDAHCAPPGKKCHGDQGEQIRVKKQQVYQQ